MAERKPISSKIRFEVFKRDSFTCQYCGRSAPNVVLEVDHITPVNGGGGNEMANLITACHDCNRGKGAIPLNIVAREYKYPKHDGGKPTSIWEQRLVKLLNELTKETLSRPLLSDERKLIKRIVRTHGEVKATEILIPTGWAFCGGPEGKIAWEILVDTWQIADRKG